MQTIKGLIALLLVAIAVFTLVVIYNRKTEPTYETNLKKDTMAEAIKPASHEGGQRRTGQSRFGSHPHQT